METTQKTPATYRDGGAARDAAFDLDIANPATNEGLGFHSVKRTASGAYVVILCDAKGNESRYVAADGTYESIPYGPLA